MQPRQQSRIQPSRSLHDPISRYHPVCRALLAGALNSVAGGGSFFSFPTLIFTGVPAINANATNTIALWPGSVASVVAYRRQFSTQRPVLIVLSIASIAGGLLGALLLLRTPEATF